MGHTHQHPNRPAGHAAIDPQPTRARDQQPAAAPRTPGRRARRGGIPAETTTLLHRAQAGDRDAFAELYRAYVGNVRRYLTARMHDHDRDAVPDLVQDTFCAALHELDRAPEDVPGWLIQLAARMCTRHAWSQRRYLRAALTIGERQRHHNTAPAPATPPQVALALAELDPDERRTLQLRFLDGQPRHATARLMDCSPWAVTQTQNRALRRLAARLTADGVSSPRHAGAPS
jgi:RNA polymerase sigma-70 factor (ECF subfamily)